MHRRTLMVLTWITVVGAIASALWLAVTGPRSRGETQPPLLGRPAPPPELPTPGSGRADDNRAPAASRSSAQTRH